MKNVYAGACAVVLSIAAWAPALAQQQGGPYYGHHMWGGGGWMFLGPVMMIVVLVALVAGVVLVIRWLGGPHHPAGGHGRHGGRDAMDILRERFARGEIDKEEFEERRRLLDS